jgi:thiamine-monophosphate kinase
MGRSIGDVGEFGLIAELTAVQAAGDGVLLGAGDDAAVVAAPDGRVVVSTDVLVEGVHFKGEWSGAEDIGRRAAAASLADIAAMGARPTALVVAFTGPPGMAAQWAVDAARGLAQEAAEVGASVVGGDVARGRQVSLTVTALGDLEGRTPVTRSGARPGEQVALAGRQGWAAAGLAVLSRGFRSPRILVAAYRRPEPPYRAGPAAALAGATAMIDVSDGLLADAGHLARASGVTIDLDPALLPVGQPLVDAAAAFNADPMAWVLGGGDDHALLATFPAGAQLPDGFRTIGSVGRHDEADVLVAGALWTGPAGHEHFR